ncbi:MAG: T9SS type A sorting domain-containing protein [Flavobacteriales bacterium]|nr:T9SS type A sorting domain-containing protein [Flavobacteriales bacterium]
MRSLTFFFLLLCSVVSAQNWALLNPTYKYNYSNDGSDTISNQIFVTQIDTLGVDSFRYELNSIAAECEPCSGYSTACNSTHALIIGQPQFLGPAMTYADQEWSFFIEDTISIDISAVTGASWVSSSGVGGTLLSTDASMVVGVSDSVKLIAFTNGDTVTISKDHGVVEYRSGPHRYILIGVQGGTNEGSRFPEIIDLFDYQAGDVLQYHGTYHGTDGYCILQSDYTIRYEVTSRIELGDRTNYVLSTTRTEHFWGYPIIGSGGCPNDYYDNQTIDTLGINHAQWTTDNFLGHPWMDNLWPHAFGPPPSDMEAGSFYPSWLGCAWHAHLDGSSRYVLEPSRLSPYDWNWPAASFCESDSGLWPVMMDELHGTYVEGVGMTERSYFVFEHSGQEILEGYRIEGVDHGIFLDVPRIAAARPCGIFPNPASEMLNVRCVSSNSLYMIIDTFGRAIASGKLSQAAGPIDLRDLSVGAYSLHVAGRTPERFIIAR